MAYETLTLLPISRTSDAGAASVYANSLTDHGSIQSWDLAKGCPGIEVKLLPPMAGRVEGDYEGYREKILIGFLRFGYALEKPPETIKVPTVETVEIADPPVDSEVGN